MWSARGTLAIRHRFGNKISRLVNMDLELFVIVGKSLEDFWQKTCRCGRSVTSLRQCLLGRSTLLPVRAFPPVRGEAVKRQRGA
jgi:hypothetical protein